MIDLFLSYVNTSRVILSLMIRKSRSLYIHIMEVPVV